MSEMSGEKGLKMEVFPAAAFIDLIEKPKFVKFNCKEVAADKALDQAIEFVMNGNGKLATHELTALLAMLWAWSVRKRWSPSVTTHVSRRSLTLLSLCPSLRVTNNSTRVSKEFSTL
jgi:hypothetical protein